MFRNKGLRGKETALERKKESCGICAVQMNNFRGLLSASNIERISNARVRELCGEKKRLDKMVDESASR